MVVPVQVSFLETIENADRWISRAVEESDLWSLLLSLAELPAVDQLARLADSQRYTEEWGRKIAVTNLSLRRGIGDVLAQIERGKAGRPDSTNNRGQAGRNFDEFGNMLGDDGSGDADWAPESQIADEPQLTPYQLALKEHDISPTQARRFQQEASLPEPAFRRYVDAAEEPTAAGLLREVRAAARPAPVIVPRAPMSAPMQPAVTRADVTNALAILEGLREADPEGVTEVRRILELVAKKAGLA